VTWCFAAALLLSVALVSWQLMRFGAGPLEMEVVAGELSPSGQLSPSSTTTTVRFSDGSELVVAPAASAEVASLDTHGADIRLRQGQLRLQVAKRPGANWNVLAGAYRVHVTGTSLAVTLAAGGERLDVEMFSGAVRVSGPLIDRELEVTRAQRLRIDRAQGRVSIEPVTPPETAAPSPPTEPPSSAVTDAGALQPEARAPLPSSNGAVRVHKPRPAQVSWSSKVASGKFAEVLGAAEARGLDVVYRRASMDDLEALADAARYAQRPSVARDALLAMRRRFPGSKPAKQAAFLLGRLVEDETAPSALQWYERYLVEEPRGVHASQALGRKMLILYRRGDVAAATVIAREYLTRFPEGPHAPSARKIVTGP
jgi:hypothetical protein